MKTVRITAISLFILLLAFCSSDKEETKVVVIGLDGAGWNTIDYQISKGNLPFFKKLKEEAAWTNLKTTRPTISPVIWTSIATGKNLSKHGVSGFINKEKENQKLPADSTGKKARQIWRILDDFGKKTITINWWVTDPPAKLSNGIMISDVFRKQLLVRDKQQREKLKKTVHPQKYFYIFEKDAKTNYKALIEENDIPDLPAIFDKTSEKSFKSIPGLSLYKPLVMQDIFIEKVSQYLYENENFEFFATYIRMPDIVQHFITVFIDKNWTEEVLKKLKNKTFTEAEHDKYMQKISDLLLPFYQYCEKFLGNFMTQPKYEDTTFIIISDHSFFLSRKGYGHTGVPKEYSPPAGIFVAVGPEVKKGYFEQAHVYDIAPTILYLFDLPLGKNMDGQPLTKIFDLKRKIRYKKYEPVDIENDPKNRDKEIDEKTMEELKSLGYIKKNIP